MEEAQWVTTMPVLSTAHVTRETMAELMQGGDEYMLLAAPYDNGAFVLLSSLVELPDGLADILRWLKTDQRFVEQLWVRLDPDGDTVDALPIYDW